MLSHTLNHLRGALHGRRRIGHAHGVVLPCLSLPHWTPYTSSRRVEKPVMPGKRSVSHYRYVYIPVVGIPGRYPFAVPWRSPEKVDVESVRLDLVLPDDLQVQLRAVKGSYRSHGSEVSFALSFRLAAEGCYAGSMTGGLTAGVPFTNRGELNTKSPEHTPPGTSFSPEIESPATQMNQGSHAIQLSHRKSRECTAVAGYRDVRFRIT
ncbi:hypothetical protein G7K_5234-t1 [Saitoella complicata NRRL Y-17804]|uniref:Uncharacterized protein n=1 Tax=Saitoella complicata (strain BCRC 22490 / CBS 7301 / JCM 7358 / NBRC 10748 / NRRL Y-17804) TaxID=698492 RepID=A0A0E9NMU5_SAICN|nr:hypothetical protein G7K_5234-t1 [Saitoella complicata NRRL Y-17804]